MKLYEVNQAIEAIFDQVVDEETGEIKSDSDELMAKLDDLQMERQRILEYLAKLVLNTRSEITALKDEEMNIGSILVNHKKFLFTKNIVGTAYRKFLEMNGHIAGSRTL